MVWTTDRTNQGNDVAAYRRFNGTSAAAPHVAGVAALMMSEQNNRGQFTPQSLAPDDIEFLVQRYATDKDVANNPGYDDGTGWGLLNAQAIMEHLSFPEYQIYHSGPPDNRSQMMVGSNMPIILDQAMFGLSAGTYQGDRVQITDTYQMTFPANTTVLDSWYLSSAILGLFAPSFPTPTIPLDPNNWQYLNLNIQGNSVSASAITNAWFIEEDAFGGPINQWVPAPPAQLRTAFALHLHNPTATTTGHRPTPTYPSLEVYPNPTEGQLTLAYTGNAYGLCQLSVFDLTGQEVKSLALGYWSTVDQSRTINISELPAGMYMLRLAIGGDSYSKRFIKR